MNCSSVRWKRFLGYCWKESEPFAISCFKIDFRFNLIAQMSDKTTFYGNILIVTYIHSSLFLSLVLRTAFWRRLHKAVLCSWYDVRLQRKLLKEKSNFYLEKQCSGLVLMAYLNITWWQWRKSNGLKSCCFFLT